MDEEAATGSLACAHCGAAMETSLGRYCCHGCETAAAIISGAGLERYYAEREALPPRPGAPVQGWSSVLPEQLPDGHCSLRLQIDGMTCASCVWVTEKVLQATEGVEEAQVSYGTGRATLRWDPKRIDLEKIAARISALGYRPRPLEAAPTWDRALLVRLGVATFSAMNTMMLAISVYLGWWEGMDPRFAALFRWIQLLLATPVALWAAGPFFSAALQGLRHRLLHMDLPVSLGIAVLYGHGVVATWMGEDSYLDSLTMLVALLLMGRVLEQRGRTRAAAAAASLAAVLPSVVRRVTADGVENIAAEKLAVGDEIVVASGEEVGADGVVVRGEGSLRMALVTGESAPVRVAPGDRVVAGAALIEGNLRLRVDAVAAESLVSRMAKGLLKAGDRPVEPTLPDRVAPVFTAATLVVSTLTFFGWYRMDGLEPALHATIAVLVVACPCALALAAPLASAAGLGAAARRGMLLRSGDVLRRLAEVKEVALDKTGTLTGGELEVEEASDADLRIAAALERESIHPVARALVGEAMRRGIPLAEAQKVQEVAGEGISGIIGGKRWVLGRGARGGELSLHADGEIPRRLRLKDRLRPDAARTVAALRARGLRVVMLSGDHTDVAMQIGRDAGVDEVVAELRPEGKADWLRGRPTLFVGDGLNDGPALRTAAVGIAMAKGAASSLMIADGVVVTEALAPLLAGLRAAEYSRAAVRGNLRRSLLYNVSAVAAAAIGLVNPLVAALLMPLSSGLVIWGAARIERQVAKESVG